MTDDIPLRAFAHPLRLQMLSLLTGVALSAAEVARHLGTTQANASYHLRRLERAGLLEVAEVISVRGGVARRYRHAPERGERLRHSDLSDHQMIVAALSAELRRRTDLRSTGRGHGPLTDAELWVDQQTWQDVCERVTSAILDLHAAAQRPGSPGTVRSSSTVSMFLMRTDEAAP